MSDRKMTAQTDDAGDVNDMTDTENLSHHTSDMLRYNRWQNSCLFASKGKKKKTECSGRDHWPSTRRRVIVADISIERISTRRSQGFAVHSKIENNRNYKSPNNG